VSQTSRNRPLRKERRSPDRRDLTKPNAPGRTSPLPSSVSQVATEIIQKANREHPADAILRETFKRLRVLNTDETREITCAVFSYYRWYGWLNKGQPIPLQIEHALRLAQQSQNSPSSFPVSDLRAKAVPDWVASEVQANDEWFQVLQSKPNLWLRAKRGHGKVLAKQLGRAKIGVLPDALIYQGDEDLFRLPEFHAGEFELQDISSQAVGFACHPQPGETWWDACAGEGGKLLHLSDLMENKGLIWASDRAEWRLKHLKRRAGRAKVFNYRAALWNGGAKPPTKTKFDGVLVDAPCSGLGTWQRNPHARWTTTVDDVKELATVQKQLLSNVAESIKPGGKLIYAVCTVTNSETTEVAEYFEKRFPEFATLPAPNPLNPGAPAPSRIWIWPQESCGNGMFIACWRRTA
jgi:16S rRNA (cytosine967-C5)-methyltransferase